VKRRAGFTLIEVLAVVLLTGIVLGVALDFYVDLSRASQRAVDHTRNTRRVSAVLDRITQDLEAVVLVKKPDAVDPLSHPWIFRAESRLSEIGADRIKFVTRNHDPHRTAVAESDLAVVSWVLRRDEEGALALWRAESPWLPGILDREFPEAGDPRELLVTDRLAAFGVLLLDDAQVPVAQWDSSLLVDSSELPTIVEVRLAMLDKEGEEEQQPLEEASLYRRQIRLPVRPIDLEAMLAPTEEEEAGEEGGEQQGLAGKTVCDCLPCQEFASNPSGARLLQEIGGQPAADWIHRLRRDMSRRVYPHCR
jgi:prepilin-type N-terminal cleavage/methylation domain-containing protein